MRGNGRARAGDRMGYIKERILERVVIKGSRLTSAFRHW